MTDELDREQRLPDIVLEEQGLRDGLQSEDKLVPTSVKLSTIDALVDAGLRRVQVCSFVHPRLVPQMADAEAVCRGLKPRPGVTYTALVLNEKGVQRAIDAGLRHVSASISVSDTHSRKNTRMSLPEAQQRYVSMVQLAKAAGLTVRGGLQCAFGCRYEGTISHQRVLELVDSHLALGVDELVLADSTGMAHPGSIQDLVGAAMERAGDRPVALHLHDTEGKGLANVLAAMQVGARFFDTGFGGLGGCPFIKGASGNIPTEDLATMVGQMGKTTGIDVHAVVRITVSMGKFLGRDLPSKMHRVLANDQIKVELGAS